MLDKIANTALLIIVIILTSISTGCLSETGYSPQASKISIVDDVGYNTTPRATQIPVASPIPFQTPLPPTITPTAVPAQPLLAYLRDGNVWFYDFINGKETQFTDTDNIKAFAWAPDGSQIAFYNNRWQLCSHAIDLTSPIPPCLTIEPAQNLFAADHAPTKLMWSPTGQQILIQQGEWWQVNLNTSQVRHIADPRDWGATWTAGNEGDTAL